MNRLARYDVITQYVNHFFHDYEIARVMVHASHFARHLECANLDKQNRRQAKIATTTNCFDPTLDLDMAALMHLLTVFDSLAYTFPMQSCLLDDMQVCRFPVIRSLYKKPKPRVDLLLVSSEIEPPILLCESNLQTKGFLNE